MEEIVDALGNIESKDGELGGEWRVTFSGVIAYYLKFEGPLDD